MTHFRPYQASSAAHVHIQYTEDSHVHVGLLSLPLLGAAAAHAQTHESLLSISSTPLCYHCQRVVHVLSLTGTLGCLGVVEEAIGHQSLADVLFRRCFGLEPQEGGITKGKERHWGGGREKDRERRQGR